MARSSSALTRDIPRYESNRWFDYSYYLVSYKSRLLLSAVFKTVNNSLNATTFVFQLHGNDSGSFAHVEVIARTRRPPSSSSRIPTRRRVCCFSLFYYYWNGKKSTLCRLHKCHSWFFFLIFFIDYVNFVIPVVLKKREFFGGRGGGRLFIIIIILFVFNKHILTIIHMNLKFYYSLQ